MPHIRILHNINIAKRMDSYLNIEWNFKSATFTQSLDSLKVVLLSLFFFRLLIFKFLVIEIYLTLIVLQICRP